MAKKKPDNFDLTVKEAFTVTNPASMDTRRTVDYRALLEWREGIPYLVSTPVRISEQPENALRALLRKCLDLPYEGHDPSLKGLSQGEAMIVNLTRQAAAGDNDARTAVIDRLLGRPQQNIKSVSLTGDLNEFLDKIAAETQTSTIEVTAETSPPPFNPEDL